MLLYFGLPLLSIIELIFLVFAVLNCNNTLYWFSAFIRVHHLSSAVNSLFRIYQSQIS